MIKILISACLMGEKVRYDGNHNLISNRLLRLWQEEGRLVRFCPESAGGLPTPRPPAEILGGFGADVLALRARVLTQQGMDVSLSFRKGAHAASSVALEKGVGLAILKARSPSCGNLFIYDGSFSGKLVAGMGTTAAALLALGIQVFNENQLEDAAGWLAILEDQKDQQLT